MRRFMSMAEAVAGPGAIAGMVALGGCAQGTWLKSGATPAEFVQDQARFQFYAEDATPEHTIPHPNKLGATLAAGLVDGIATGLQQRHKSDLCMAADGWQLVPQVQVAARALDAPVLVAPSFIVPVLGAPGSGRGPGDVAATVIPVRAAPYAEPYARPTTTALAARPLVPWTTGSTALPPPFFDEPGPDGPGR